MVVKNTFNLIELIMECFILVLMNYIGFTISLDNIYTLN